MTDTTTTEKPGFLARLFRRDAREPDAVLAAGELRADGWKNELTGLGYYERDKRIQASFSRSTRLTEETLDALYHCDDTVRRIIDLPPREMTRKWVTLSVEGDQKAGTSVLQRLEELAARQKLREALSWSRSKGGGLLFVGADDRQRDLTQPLNERAIRQVHFLEVLQPREVQVYTWAPGAQGVVPETYRIISTDTPNASYGTVIHASRFIRLDGQQTSREERRARDSWCISVLDYLYPVLRDFAASYEGMAHLLTDFSQAVLKIDGLANKMAADNSSVILTRIRLMDMARSIARVLPLDAKHEDFERKGTPVSGLDGLLDRLALRLSLATGIPQTKLFGRSPAGMNATGESDIRQWYDDVAADQEDYLRSPVERLVRLVFLSQQGPTRGREPPEWKLGFRSLWQASDKDQAETRKTQAEADAIYVGMGLPKVDVLTSRFTADGWSPETTLSLSREELEARIEEQEVAAEQARQALADARARPEGDKEDPPGKEPPTE